MQIVAGICAQEVGDFSRWRQSQPKVAAQPRNMIPVGIVDWAKRPRSGLVSKVLTPIEAKTPAGINAHQQLGYLKKT